MQVTFWGVRGTVPAPGPEMNRYGGNTACVELRTSAGALLILDCGTGAIGLGRRLMHEEFGRGAGEAAIFFSHTHWDHIQGFPFFAPLFVAGNRLTLYGPGSSAASLESILEGQLSPSYSPLYTLRNLAASIEVRTIDARAGEVVEAGGVRVMARRNPHGTTEALAYRFEEGGRALVYAADAGYPPGGASAEVRALYRGADLLIHDCTYSPEDRSARTGRGLSSVAEAAAAAVAARVKKLVMFHYDQDYGDDTLDALAARTRALLDEAGGQEVALLPAREGLSISL